MYNLNLSSGRKGGTTIIMLRRYDTVRNCGGDQDQQLIPRRYSNVVRTNIPYQCYTLVVRTGTNIPYRISELSSVVRVSCFHWIALVAFTAFSVCLEPPKRTVFTDHGPSFLFPLDSVSSIFCIFGF